MLSCTSPSVEDIPDERLIQAIASEQEWAIEALYQRYSGIAYALAFRMVADQQVAEDLLQESFVAVWRRATSYSFQSGAVHNWLLSIVHHRAIDYLRSLRRRAALKSVTLDEVEMISTTSDVWEEVWQSVQSEQVHESLLRLPPEQRLVIELAYFQGWTHAEIAAGCQIPLGTVKARMRLGLVRLKRILEQMDMSGL
ncbi:MAG TPA: sigma-70 family RNA polymerase sigma factor [Ktedonosporobacter sp.]|nr:sigma-70 family RNA polymerase sigma factor [Ktedonosporobacter sp.]